MFNFQANVVIYYNKVKESEMAQSCLTLRPHVL